MADGLNMVPETYVFCPRCAARVDTGRIQIGGRLTCHFCDHEFPVSRGPRAEADNGAGQGRAKEKTRRKRETESTGDGHWTNQAIGRPPPRGLFFAGVFGFPFRLENLLQTIVVAAVSILLILAVRTALWCVAADALEDDAHSRVLLWNGLLLSVVAGLFVALICAYLASAFGLTVLHDTSHGADSVGSWPRVLLLEDGGAIAYVGFAMLLAALPGVLSAAVWQRLGIPKTWAIIGPMPLFLPPLLFSMLEGKSPLNPFSSRVWMSILHGWRVWVTFYILSGVVVGSILAVLVFISRYGGWTVGIVASGAVAAVVWMVYFRLLGRLAWYCSGRWAKMHDFVE